MNNMLTVLKNFRIVDESLDTPGAVVVEDGMIREIIPGEGDGGPELVPEEKKLECAALEAGLVIDGRNLVSPASPQAERRLPLLMPAFVDLHAHFRDTVPLAETASPAESVFPAETLESASLAAAAGGFGTLVCMANTWPVVDTPEMAAAIKTRADALGLADIYPVLSLTRGMEGKELSGFTRLSGASPYRPRMLSEDGKDLASDSLFLSAMEEARRLGIPVSCHCDFGGDEAEAAKMAGRDRGVWSRIEENNATRRAVDLGRRAGCHIHIAHVSTKEAVETIRRAKAELAAAGREGGLTCEAAPHHIALTEEAAHRLGDESYGRVNPPLRTEEDRQALIRGILDGVIDAIATDHAPHTGEAKARGTPGFSGLETAFAAVHTCLVRSGILDLRRLSSLMSANPARLLGLGGAGPSGRGRIAGGFRADLAVIDPEALWKAGPDAFKTRGKNSPFAGTELWGKVIMTFLQGRLVYML
ncbi:MAG: dihydroorotase [Treponema sp.]|jgi:dihydroorotase|nr:dihydroorotase [Treponema sp.]